MSEPTPAIESSEPVIGGNIFSHVTSDMKTSMLDFHQHFFVYAKDHLAKTRAEIAVKLEKEMEDIEDEKEKKEILDEELDDLIWHYNELADRCYAKIGYDSQAEILVTAMHRLIIAASLMGGNAQQQMAEISREIKKEDEESYAQCVSITESMRANREVRAGDIRIRGFDGSIVE
jgi:hypothetical protein